MSERADIGGAILRYHWVLWNVLLTILFLPIIIPTELFFRARYPELRWSRKPATFQARREVLREEEVIE